VCTAVSVFLLTVVHREKLLRDVVLLKRIIYLFEDHFCQYVASILQKKTIRTYK